MNKLFSKIAALSVGLAMAVGVGVAVGHEAVREARAEEGSVSIDYTTVNDRVDGYTDEQMSYAHTTDGYTATITAQKNGGTKVTNYYPGTPGQSYKQTRFYQKNSLSIGVLSSSSVAMYITKIEIVSTTENYSNVILNADWAGVKSISKSGSGSKWTSTIIPNANVTDVSCVFGGTTNATSAVVYWTSELVVDPEISVQETARVGVGMSVEVTVSYTNLTSAITVSAGDEVDVPSTLSVTGSGETKLTITGVTAITSVAITLSSGSAEATINVEVVAPIEFHLLTDLRLLTPGSQFTFVSKYNDDYYFPTTFVEGYYLSGSTSITVEESDKSFKSIDAAVFTFDSYDEEGALIKDGNYYIGSKNFTGASITRNESLDKVTNSHWGITSIVDEIANVILTGTTSGNYILRYNGSAGRFSNYTTASNISIYTSYLAPELSLPSNVKVGVGLTSNISPTAVNFGDETISYTFNVEQEGSVVSVIYEDEVIKITGVGSGNATITVTAQSEHYGPVSETIEVEVYDTSRELTSLTLSVPEETLYKGQEYSYSGTVTANYSNGDKVEITNYVASGYEMDEIGDYEVTISYTDDGITKDAKYTLRVVQWEGVLSVGSYYVLAAKNTVEEVDHTYSMVGLNKNGTNHYGVAAEYGETLRSESALFVEEGANYNSYAFRLGNGKYLAVTKDANALTEVDSIDSTSSFTVGVINETNYSITNVQFSERSIKYNVGNATTAPRFATYKSGQTDVTLVMVSSAEIASHFETNFMHKEIPVDNHEDTNACRAEGEGAQSYYALAKAAFNAMPLASRENFLASSEYAARLEAWAIANGEEINADSQLVSAASGSLFDSNDSNNNSMIIIIAIASSSAFAFSIALLLRKKKRQ